MAQYESYRPGARSPAAALEDMHLGLFEDSWSLVMNDVDVSDAISTIIGANLLPSDLVEIVQPMDPQGALMPLAFRGLPAIGYSKKSSC